MSEYTKGPWVVMEKHVIKNIVRMEGAKVKNKYDAVPYAAVGGCPDGENGKQILEANARLIAAAPDLLEALQDLVYSAHNNTGHEPSLSCFQRDMGAAREAISKALPSPPEAKE